MKQEYYWSIAITPQWVQAGIWTVENKSTKVISVSPPARWEEQEDLVTIIDSTLSAAVDELPDDADEPSSTVFGVSPSWVHEGTIKKEYLVTIRHICQKLDLKPSGFVVHPEAIAHSIKLGEGAPLTGVIMGIEDSNLDVTLFKLGNLVGTVNVGRSVSIEEDLIEALTRFGTDEAFPSRFILYNGKESILEDFKQKLHDFDWKSIAGEKVRFLHTPKIELVTPQEKILAISQAGATELGIVGEFGTREKTSGISTETKEHDLGEHDNVAETSLTPEDLGFAIDKDITAANNEVSENTTKKFSFSFLSRLIPKLGKSTKNVGMPVIHEPKRGHKKLLALFALLPIIGIVVLGLVWWFVPKAAIIVFVAPQTLEEVHTIILDENAGSVNGAEMIIPANKVSLEVAGVKSKSTTGRKTVGEKAKGTVTVRNGTSQAVQLKVGTILEAGNNLEFEVVEAASVSAATSPSTPGSSDVGVVAGTIGEEHNLAKDTTLSVGNYPSSEVDAIVKDTFTGGSSRDIKAVSENDLESLVEDLTKELLEEGKKKMNAETGSDNKLLEDALEETVIKKTFSQKAGDEADSVSLELTLEITGPIAATSDILSLAKSILEDQIPDGFVFRDEQIKYEFKLDDTSVGAWYFETTFVLNLLPDVNPDEVVKRIAGKTPVAAKSSLEGIAGYKGSEIVVSPSLPSFLGNIPRNTKNIAIEIEAER